MIKKVGKKWYLYTHDGKRILGRHATQASAEKQEAAINISKARAAGHRISKKKTG
ncbi:MAG: hypothetical protein US94_C0006G0009 [Berkelbacteria bacterium GW2011_GWB1_38_5]|uniref:DUF1508 domain-containing protein n=2 Tax=Candidatus Berkelbacteria TaxID=1618330 RepID=A0A0G0LF60_9BACT|nr:MAG: hypothetical protein US94_C0006G0009 [Berkelbacteria bacterium GW2011_GWB1_38_5]KKQ90523.1 MAG: hypothetical protein UT15_C0011G0005 [Berkelbacteria bacterium GW2011_GWA1_39_10]